MDRWRGKVAVVTGASAGIGLAVVKRLVCEGLIVVGFARRKEKMLNEMKSVKGPGQFFAVECDVSKENDVVEAFDYVEKTLKTIHILVNNAGTINTKSIEEAELKDLQSVIDTNLVGLVHCTQKATKLMRKNEHEAHIINVNSTVGHKVPLSTRTDGTTITTNVYSPTKFAVTSLSKVLSFELSGSKIRVTSVSPGYTKTDIGGADIHDEDALGRFPHLNPEDIADAIVYVVGAPLHVQVTELMIQPLGELF